MAQIPLPPGAASTLQNIPQRDTGSTKTNTREWENESARISFTRPYSDATYLPDTTLHSFYRRLFTQPWHRNLGNHGAAAYNWLFTPEYRVGPTSGYHAFDIYRYNIDSLYYYNTNRPYSHFLYQLGGKLEQTAQLMHTQNVRPNWNIALQYQKVTSPGTFLLQRTNHDNAWITTNYQSPRLRYRLYGAVVYNKEQQDENGGIADESLLESEDYNDRRTVPIRFEDASLGNVGDYQRSAISNTLRDFAMQLKHSYSFGRIDTLYNEDSTRFTFELNPRFGISHHFQLSTEKHTYKDLRPDSLRYDDFFRKSFSSSTPDSVISEQHWLKIDNRFMLNSFIGQKENQLSFSAGIGNRIDRFKTWYVTGQQENNIISNYLAGEVKKEIKLAGQWYYNADALLYVTGEAAGNSDIHASAGKDLGGNLGDLRVGARQAIHNAPYNYTIYQNQFDTIKGQFNKESITQLYGSYGNYNLGLGGGIRNYIINNYIHLDAAQMPAQFAGTFNVTQIWIRKIFRWHILVLDNELAYQQIAGNAPVNVPALMGRHQLSIETNLFKSALLINTGIQVRYHTAYNAMAYSPIFNRFYYQDSYYLSNAPEAAVYFSFRIKRFRAYLMGDQIQLAIADKNIINYPAYPMPDISFRMGFSWIFIN